MFLNLEDLDGGVINFKYHGHIGPQDKVSKAGKPYQIYTFDLEVQSTGQRNEYGISPKSAEFGNLLVANIGDTVQAFAKGEWVNWKLIKGVSEPDGMPHNNAGEVKAEQKYTKTVQNGDVKSIAISLQGLVQAYIVSRGAEGKTIDEQIAFAVETRELILEKAEEIYNAENS